MGKNDRKVLNKHVCYAFIAATTNESINIIIICLSFDHNCLLLWTRYDGPSREDGYIKKIQSEKRGRWLQISSASNGLHFPVFLENVKNCWRLMIGPAPGLAASHSCTLTAAFLGCIGVDWKWNTALQVLKLILRYTGCSLNIVCVSLKWCHFSELCHVCWLLICPLAVRRKNTVA